MTSHQNERAWPYDLPIWRRSHRATAPGGETVAEVDPANEVSMGNPTCGTLRLSTGLELARCSPSFLWSDDSRYLAVPRFFDRLLLFRMQRLVIIDVIERRAFASRAAAFYFQTESFADGLLVATKEPFRKASQLSWQLPRDLSSFRPVELPWTTPRS